MNHKNTTKSKPSLDQTTRSVSRFRDVRKLQATIDAELFIRQAFEVDPARGYELLFKRYYKQLCSHCIRFVYSKEAAEDLVVEVFSQFWSKQLHQSVSTSYRAYLYTSVRHAAFHYMRRDLSRSNHSEELTDLSVATSHSTPQQELQFQELVIKIEEIIGSLSPQSQKVFLLSRFEGKRNAAIAEELGISVKTVEGHITKGLSVLRKALESLGLLTLTQLIIPSI